jgi:hypothetical protein
VVLHTVSSKKSAIPKSPPKKGTTSKPQLWLETTVPSPLWMYVVYSKNTTYQLNVNFQLTCDH